MTDDIKVSCEYNYLRLSCSDQAFARLRDLLIAEAGVTAAVQSSPSRITVIDVEAMRPVPPRQDDTIVLIGCAVLTMVFGSVFFTGLSTIMGWLK